PVPGASVVLSAWRVKELAGILGLETTVPDTFFTPHNEKAPHSQRTAEIGSVTRRGACQPTGDNPVGSFLSGLLPTRASRVHPEGNGGGRGLEKTPDHSRPLFLPLTE